MGTHVCPLPQCHRSFMGEDPGLRRVMKQAISFLRLLVQRGDEGFHKCYVSGCRVHVICLTIAMFFRSEHILSQYFMSTHMLGCAPLHIP